MFDAVFGEAYNYTAHFLDRYKWRFLGGENMSMLDLLKRFIPNNSMEVIKVLPSEDNNEQRIFARLKEGIGLGFKESVLGKELFHLKTFISTDMIKERQLDDFNLTSKMYDELWNDWESKFKKRA